MSTSSPVVPITPIRIVTVAPSEDAALLVELCGGDRLEAWRIALGRAKSDPKLADHWISVADATVEHNTVPVPSGVAGLLLELVHALQYETVPVPGAGFSPTHTLTARRLANEPRVRHWAKTARAFMNASRAGH